MRAFAITIENNKISEDGFSVLNASSKVLKNPFTVEKFNAIEPHQAQQMFIDLNLTWEWPQINPRTDLFTGLYMVPYPTKHIDKRVACFLSHYLLWDKCVELDEPILILEHDAVFVKQLKNPISLLASNKSITSINNPFRATRKAKIYHDIIQSRDNLVQGVPTIDDLKIPQGLPGNSAYMISPSAAEELISGASYFGCWPNDAYMCKQLFNFLYVSKTYYTEVQGLPSTTSL